MKSNSGLTKPSWDSFFQQSLKFNCGTLMGDLYLWLTTKICHGMSVWSCRESIAELVKAGLVFVFLFCFGFIYLLICVHVYQRSEDNLGKLLLSLHHVNGRGWNSSGQAGDECPYLLSHPSSLPGVRGISDWMIQLGHSTLIILWDSVCSHRSSHGNVFNNLPICWLSSA